MRRGPGVLLTDPPPASDTIYDGAHQMKSTAFVYGPPGGRWSSPQTYGASFRSATPRPWQRKPSRNESLSPVIGPGDYEPYGDTHSLSASISWQTRGRTGPVGHPFDASRRSPQFQSSTSRCVASTKSRALSNEDCFILASDARREQTVRTNFAEALQRRTGAWNPM